MAWMHEGCALASPRVMVGLGNVGSAYRLTPHNVGFQLLDRLMKRWPVIQEWKDDAWRAVALRVGRAEPFYCVWPGLLMNRSGPAVASWLRKHRGVAVESLWVAHDDVDVPLGKHKIKRGGGAGGHNGLRSLIGTVGADFWRLRLGVGRPPQGEVADYVLRPYHPDVASQVEHLLDAMVASMVPWIEGQEG
jgi:PTH1 family peptidyl-tRNA hydrolase